MQNAANSLEFALNSVMKSENKQMIYANTYIYAFLIQSVKFNINNFFSC